MLNLLFLIYNFLIINLLFYKCFFLGQETAWVPLWNASMFELYGDLPKGVYCNNVTGATCLVLRMTVTAFQVEIG